jgi:predicted nucleic acid-binding protein
MNEAVALAKRVVENAVRELEAIAAPALASAGITAELERLTEEKQRLEDGIAALENEPHGAALKGLLITARTSLDVLIGIQTANLVKAALTPPDPTLLPALAAMEITKLLSAGIDVAYLEFAKGIEV